jgi:hypothetical protein
MPETVASVLREYDDDFLLCRNLGHHWEVIGYYRAPDGIVRRSVTCTRCETDRSDVWERSSGDRHPSSYRYAHGYRVETGSGDKPGSTDVRLEVIRRAKVYANEQAMLDSMTNGKLGGRRG